jgi:hypothetical protein
LYLHADIYHTQLYKGSDSNLVVPCHLVLEGSLDECC